MYFFIQNVLLLTILLITGNVKPKFRRSACEPDCTNFIRSECNKFEVELSATITNCENIVHSVRSTITPKPTDEDEKFTIGNEPIKCGKKLRSSIKITNQGDVSSLNQYIVIDYVIDSVTGEKVSLLNPYVLILRQKPILQLYGLKYTYMVNGEATEHVVNKQNPNYLGCDDMSEDPTCGAVKLNGDVIPFSQGFCCSCDERKNFQRQPRSDKHLHQSKTFNFQSFINNYARKRELLLDDEPLVEIKPKQSKAKTEKQYHTTLRFQKRGGQNCQDSWAPYNANPSSYHDSAHCLRFSKVWYSVYQLSQPILEHSLYIRLFQKRELEDGIPNWIDLTQGQIINIGTSHNKYRDKAPTFQLTYGSGQRTGNDIPFGIDYRSKRLLIPSLTPKHSLNQHPETRGGPSEYLVVDNMLLEPSGEQCDKIGVGYSAFFNQKDRCGVQKGSCLRNQPFNLWRKDNDACKNEGRGQYFLKNFAHVPNEAVRYTHKGRAAYLALHYTDSLESTLDLEVKADDNIPFKNEAVAKITEVYTDATSELTTVIIIKIHNNGLVSNYFRPKLADCPLELPIDWGTLEGESKLIPPQRHFTFFLRIVGTLPASAVYCSIEVLDSDDEVVAIRRVRLAKWDRCICSWHCLCACELTTDLGCVPLSMKHYQAAGFIGSMPLTTTMIECSSLETVLFGFLFILLIFAIILLFMGITKAIIGLFCFVPIGIWGLDMLIDPSQLNRYFEPHLRNRSVIFDDQNWPVDPDTQQRIVRVIDGKIEFCLNIVFFFTYPIMIALTLFKKLCCPFYSYIDEEEEKGHCFEAVNSIIYKKFPDEKDSDDTAGTSDSENLDQFCFIDESGSGSQ